MIRLLLAALSAYLIGSIPTSYLIGRAKGIDVRKKGSGNVGATNVLRVVGKLPAIITLIIDILKGVVVVTLLAHFFFLEEPVSYNIFRSLLGISAIIGHNWSIFLKFKGGKGVATSCGVLLCLTPKPMAFAAIIFFITVMLTRYVSLGSILLSVAVPIIAVLLGTQIEFVILSITICILISYRHKDNIKRLIAGTESRISKNSF